MGIIDSIAGQILGGGAQNNVINAIMSMVGQQEGGLAGLVNKFKASGLGDIVNSHHSRANPSWIGQRYGHEARRSGRCVDRRNRFTPLTAPPPGGRQTHPGGEDPPGRSGLKGDGLAEGVDEVVLPHPCVS
jgi:hypothetical protein